jgi:hypothetical protein
MRFLLAKRTGKNKADSFNEAGEKCMGSMSWEYFLWIMNLLDNKIVFFLMDIVRLFIKALHILDKYGNSSD